MSEATELFPEAYTKEHSIKDLEETVRKALKGFISFQPTPFLGS